MAGMTKIQVTVKSIENRDRPSGHRLSKGFVGAIDYTETFSCRHSRKHALLFMKVLDLSAMKCGIDTGEFPADLAFTREMDVLIQKIEGLHGHCLELSRNIRKEDPSGA